VSWSLDPERDKQTMGRRNADALAQTLDELAGHLPHVAQVLRALPLSDMSGVETVCWWTAANGWLGNRRPCDVINVDPEAVERAARRLSDPSPL
jgi:hypothetical protein